MSNKRRAYKYQRGAIVFKMNLVGGRENMFDIEKFYKAAHEAATVDVKELVKYIKSFESLVLWGAGNLGEEIGNKLLELGVSISYYWDLRAKDIVSLNGINIIEPFSNEFNKEKTLIISCITNPYYQPFIKQRLLDEKVKYMYGYEIYQALVCSITINNIDVKSCYNKIFCNTSNCVKLNNLAAKANKGIFLSAVFFTVNQKCSLSCKNCSAYMGQYTEEKRINFPVERILNDIDRICASVDFMTRVLPYGGEPFLHPDLDKIINKLATKKNIGMIDITSNGVFKISKKIIDSLHYDNLQVGFSNYSESLTTKQQEIVNRNYEILKSEGVNVKMNSITPVWTVPTTLEDKFFSVDEMINKKLSCLKQFNNFIWATVKNGKYYSCGLCDSIYNLGIADYPTDYVDIDKCKTDEELTMKIRENLDRQYYGACMHCGSTSQSLKAGVQGYEDFTNGLIKRNF